MFDAGGSRDSEIFQGLGTKQVRSTKTSDEEFHHLYKESQAAHFQEVELQKTK